MSGPVPAQGRRLSAIVFDVNETLTDLSPVGDVLTGLGMAANAVRWWFSVVLRDGFAVAASGGSAAFVDLAAAALAEVAAASGLVLPADAGEQVVYALRRCPLHADVAPSLARLGAAGVPAFALTNGSAQLARGALSGAGLLGSFAGVLSVTEVGHWKPRPEPYRYAAQVAGAPPERMALVAVHPWDVHGASGAGFQTGWANRNGVAYPPVFRPPTVSAARLDELIERLLALAG